MIGLNGSGITTALGHHPLGYRNQPSRHLFDMSMQLKRLRDGFSHPRLVLGNPFGIEVAKAPAQQERRTPCPLRRNSLVEKDTGQEGEVVLQKESVRLGVACELHRRPLPSRLVPLAVRQQRGGRGGAEFVLIMEPYAGRGGTSAGYRRKRSSRDGVRTQATPGRGTKERMTHPPGDVVLPELDRRALRNVRRSDFVGHDHHGEREIIRWNVGTRSQMPLGHLDQAQQRL